MCLIFAEETEEHVEKTIMQRNQVVKKIEIVVLSRAIDSFNSLMYFFFPLILKLWSFGIVNA